MAETKSSMPLFRVLTFGTLRVERLIDAEQETYAAVPASAFRGTYPRIVLRSLLCSPTRSLRRSALLDRMLAEGEEPAEMESETDPEKLAAQRLKNAVIALRAIFAVPQGTPSLLLLDETQTYQLAGQAQIWVDADACQGLLDEAQQQMRYGDNPLELVKEAAGYFAGGRFLEEEDGWWVLGRRGSLDALRQTGMRLLVDLYQQQDLLLEAEAYLRGVLEADYGNQEAYYRLMMVLTKQGKYPEALILADSIQERFAVEEGDEEERKLIEATKALILHVKKLWRQQKQQMIATMTITPMPSQGAGSLSPHIGAPGERSVSIEDRGTTWSVSNLVPPHAIMAGMEELQKQRSSDIDTMQTQRQSLHHLLMLGSTALVLSPYAEFYPDGSEQLNPFVLEELETITASYWRLCANTSLDLLGNLSEHFRTVVSLLRRALLYTTTQRLCSLSGEIAQILGKTLFDLQEYTLAWSYYMFSLKAAQAVSNHDLWAAGIGRMILLLIYWEHPQKALSLLQEVHQLTIQNTRIFCWLAVVEAEVYAYLGDVEACDTALKTAKDISKNKVLGEDRYAIGFSASRLAGYEGACFVRLHQPDRALSALQQALSLLDPQSIRRQSTLLTDMGIAYAQQGNIQKACQLADQALSITKQTKSKIVLERIRLIRFELEMWKEWNEVKDLERHLDATSTLITM